MATGFGIEPTINADGTVTVGTSAQDIRRIWGGLYTEGVISGAITSTSASALTYSISPGLLNLWYAGSALAKETVLMPLPAVTVNTTAGPSSGSRTDYIWVRQNPPSSNPSTGSQITFGVSSTNPRNSNSPGEYFVLDQYTVPAGMTATNKATKIESRNYAIPYGTGGLMLKLVDTFNGKFTAQPNADTAVLSGKITIPTDQQIKITCGVTVISSGSARDGVNASVSMDGSRVAWWRTAVSNKPSPETYEWTDIIEVPAGTHTFDFRRSEMEGTGSLNLMYTPNGVPGSYLYVESMGIIV